NARSHLVMSSARTTAYTVAPIFLTRPFLFLGVSPSTVDAISVFIEAFLLTASASAPQQEMRMAIRPSPGPIPSITDIVASSNTTTQALIELYFGRIPTASAPTKAKLGVAAPLALACHYFNIAWSDWFLALGGARFTLVIETGLVYVVKESDGRIGVVWSASPSCTSHPVIVHPLPDFPSPKEESPSRPSSRSSNSSTYSTYSFASCASSSSSSATSVSSLASATKPTSHFSHFHDRSRPLAPTTQTSTSTIPKPKTRPTPTKYLYEGGVSTVLTGGVMLGAPSPSSSAPKPTKPAFAPSSRFRDPRAPLVATSSGSWA
ncbi:hypothetical protein H0H87_003770, partial [Tephrocybe sp. NHM501043]